VKLVASAITIGTGGSAGREGPAAQISAGFGSLLGRWFLREPQERRIAVAAGIGAGIGAIFRAPLGGAILAAEILYVHDIEVEAIIPSLVASIVGFTVFGGFEGFSPIIGPHPTLGLGAPVQLAYYAVLGLACGVGGLLYARGFYGTAAAFRRLRLPPPRRPS
jgi:CIC family chloride channel protein